jgi:hypothetical protein
MTRVSRPVAMVPSRVSSAGSSEETIGVANGAGYGKQIIFS